VAGGFKLQSKAFKWAGSAILAAGTVWLWAGYLATPLKLAPPTQSAHPIAAATPVPQLPQPTALETYQAAFDKPLFHPSRRPFPDKALQASRPAETAPVEVMPPQGVLLRGAVISGPFRSAIFERTGQPGYFRMLEGEELQGWRLIRIARKEVVLRFGDKEVTWQLTKDAR
jgi:hypothetical protein